MQQGVLQAAGHLVDDSDDFGAINDFGLESAAVKRNDGGGDGVFDEAGVHGGGRV